MTPHPTPSAQGVAEPVKVDGYHRHEVVDRVAMVQNHLETALDGHPAVEGDAELEGLLDAAQSALSALYQAAGNRHLPPLSPLTPEAVREMCKEACAEKSIEYSNAGDTPRANAAWVCKEAIRKLDLSPPSDGEKINAVPQDMQPTTGQRGQPPAGTAPNSAPPVVAGAGLPENLDWLIGYLRDQDCPTQHGDAGKQALWEARQQAAAAIESLRARVDNAENLFADALLAAISRRGINVDNWDGDSGVIETLAQCIAMAISGAEQRATEAERDRGVLVKALREIAPYDMPQSPFYTLWKKHNEKAITLANETARESGGGS